MTTYSDLRRTLREGLREIEEAYFRLREAGASDNELTAVRRCHDALVVAWRNTGNLADEV